VKVFLKQFTPKPEGLELVVPGRRFVREGEMFYYNSDEKKVKPRFFFLFNDILLMAKPVDNGKYWLRYLFILKSILKIEDETTGWSDYNIQSPGSDMPDVEFRLTTPKKVFIFFARTARDKNEWVRDLKIACNSLSN